MSAFTTVMAWLGLRQISRIDALEKSKAEAVTVKEEFDEVKTIIGRIEEKGDRRHEENTKRLDRILENMANNGNGHRNTSGYSESRW